MAKDDRLYARFTLDFPDSPKFIGLSVDAKWAYVEMVIYSRRMMTDGFIANAVALAKWGASVCLELASNDVQNPSLIEVENGYQIHDFAEHQSTKAEIDALRNKRKSAGRKGGEASARARAKQVPKQNRSKSNPETETETETDRGGYVDDDTSRNVAAREVSSSFADGTPIPEPPAEISASQPKPAQPGSAARTVVRQELGKSGYPRKTMDRLAVQVERLARQGIADDVVRESLREWERRSGARPEWLESISGDVVQARRSQGSPSAPARPSKLRGIAELAAAARAQENNTHRQELTQ